MKDKFWLENPSILFEKTRLQEFIPLKEMNLSEKLNSLIRFSFYVSFILTLYYQKYLYLYFFIFVTLLTIVIYKFQYEKFNIRKITNNFPTQENPFMNYNYITDKPNKKTAIKSHNNNDVKKEINHLFNEKLYRDVSDLYGKNNSQRQFYTMPCTEIVNNQTEFAKWLYKTDETCKEKGIKCASYN